MGLLTWMIFGLIAGFIASKLVNHNGSGLIMNMIIGLVGSVIGGWVAEFLHVGTSVSGFNLSSFALAVLGGVLLLLFVNFFRQATA